MTKLEQMMARKKTLQEERKSIKEKLVNKRSEMTDADVTTAMQRANEITDELDTLNDELMEERSRSFAPPTPAPAPTINKDNYRSSPEYRDAFFRSYINGKIAEADAKIMEFGKRAITDMNGGSVTSGAEYLVPTTTMNTIERVMVEFGPVFAAVTRYGFTGNVSLPIGTTGAVTNNADGTDTLAFSFTEVSISQQAVVAVIKVKNLLVKNSISALESFIAYEIGKYLGLQLENYALNGTGIAPVTFLGIIPALKAAPSAAKTYTDMDWSVVAAILGGVEAPYGDRGVWIMKRSTFFNQFFGMTDANGQPMITSTVGGGYNIGGRPVLFTTQMPAGDTEPVLYGDIKAFIANLSQDVVIESDASAGFAADETIWRGKVYGGGKPMFAKSTFTYYTKA